MLKKILSVLGLEGKVSEDLVKKGLQKVYPRFKKFFADSSKFGYPVGATLGFLKSEFTGEGDQAVNPHQRPDIAANIETQRQNQEPGRLASKALNVAGGAAVGGLAGSAIAGLAGMFPEEESKSPAMQSHGVSGSREEELRRYNEHAKKKKLYESLRSEFEQYYPESGQQRQSMQQSGGNIQRLIQLLEQRKRGMT